MGYIAVGFQLFRSKRSELASTGAYMNQIGSANQGSYFFRLGKAAMKN